MNNDAFFTIGLVLIIGNLAGIWYTLEQIKSESRESRALLEKVVYHLNQLRGLS